MPSLQQICQTLAAAAPLDLAESWDNVGLLVGDRTAAVRRVMTCLTITPAVVDEAVQGHVDLVVTHHPLPFKPLVKLTTDTVAGGMILRLVAAGVAVYSSHTAMDSAAAGINATWSDELGLVPGGPLIPASEHPQIGAGRWGRWSSAGTLGELVRRAGAICGASSVRFVSPPDDPTSGSAPTPAPAPGPSDPAAGTIQKVAVACGSGGSFIDAAIAKGCQALVTGEATFHTLLDAQSRGLAVVLVGHYASERFAMERLATAISRRHPDLECWASRREADPLRVALLDC